jgi:hypothetical protein
MVDFEHGEKNLEPHCQLRHEALLTIRFVKMTSYSPLYKTPFQGSFDKYDGVSGFIKIAVLR